jgi:hypothetical protein
MQDETKRRGGRPPKLPSERQSERAMVTFTRAEYREVLKAAARQPVGTFIRELVLRSLARRRG